MGSSLNTGGSLDSSVYHSLSTLFNNVHFRPSLAKMEEEFYDLSSFAVADAAMEGKSLLETVKMVKPNIIIGKDGELGSPK